MVYMNECVDSEGMDESHLRLLMRCVGGHSGMVILTVEIQSANSESKTASL